MASHTIAIAVLNNTPASQRGLSGTYYVLSFGTWTVETDETDYYEVSENLQNKPKTLVVYRNGEVKEETFEGRIGVNNYVSSITEAEKQRLVEAWRKYKATRKVE